MTFAIKQTTEEYIKKCCNCKCKEGIVLTTLGILGTTHDPDLRIRYHYPLQLLEDAILKFNPDVVCGEVLPESWSLIQEDPTYNADNFIEPASEYYDLIFPLCRSKNIEFIPIDWCELDVWFDFDPFVKFPKDKQDELERQLNQWDENIRSTWDKSPIPFNSDAYDTLAKEKYDWLYSINPKSQYVQWICRNQIMAQRIANAARLYKDRRILTIVGADHNYILHELLKDGEWNLVYPLNV